MKKITKSIFIGSGIFLIAFSLLPYITYRIINIGVWFPALLGVFFITLPAIATVLKKLLKKTYRPVKIIFWAIFCIGSAYLLVMMAVIAGGSFVPATANPDAVIVMGGGIEGDRPQLMLQYRLDAAADFLQTHPGVICVVTGGEGSNSNRTEADVMKQYLAEKGIAPERILTEDRSTDSNENLKFAAKILEENGIGHKVVIITDRFHQYRSALYAKHAGLDSAPYSSESPYILQQSFWIREAFAMIKYFIITV